MIPPSVLSDRVIAWEEPLLNADGSPFTDPLRVEVWRHTTNAGITTYADLETTATWIADVLPGIGQYEDTAAATGTTWHYWVVMVDSEGTTSDLAYQTPRLYA